MTLLQKAGFVAGAVTLAWASTAGCRDKAYEAAHQKFVSSLGSMTITIYPTFVRSATEDYDPESAAGIAEFFVDSKLANASIMEERVAINGQWRMNQARMFRESAAAISEHVKAHPIQTNYALLVEYLLGSNGAVVGIHCYVVDAKGQLAAGEQLNSHHKIFADSNPKSIEDAHYVLLQQLSQSFGKYREPRGS